MPAPGPLWTDAFSSLWEVVEIDNRVARPALEPEHYCASSISSGIDPALRQATPK